MKKNRGFALIESILGILILLVSSQILYGTIRLKYNVNSYEYDYQKMIELWESEERCEIYCFKEKLIKKVIEEIQKTQDQMQETIEETQDIPLLK